jgi:DNA polymerase-3 subunit beta
MNLIVTRSNLRDGLGIVEKTIGDGTNLPILKNVLLQTEDGKIKLTATNLEIATTAFIPGKIIDKGSVTVPALVFKELITNLQSERVVLESKKTKLTLKTDNYNASIQGLPSEDFPIIPKIKNQTNFIELNSGVFKNALEQAVVSARFSELRPELNSVLFNFCVEDIKLAATDSFRLSEKTIPKSQFTTNHKSEFRFLIPLKTSQELIRILKNDEPLKIWNDQNQVLFETNEFQLISRLIEGSFPDYSAIIPKEFDTTVTVNREELLNALRLTGIFSSKVNEVRIKISESRKGILEVFSMDQTLGENNYLLAAKIYGKPREISFNWRYLSDGLRALTTEDVFWGINEENKPAIIRAPGDTSYFYILMPILKT